MPETAKVFDPIPDDQLDQVIAEIIIRLLSEHPNHLFGNTSLSGIFYKAKMKFCDLFKNLLFDFHMTDYPYCARISEITMRMLISGIIERGYLIFKLSSSIKKSHNSVIDHDNQYIPNGLIDFLVQELSS